MGCTSSLLLRAYEAHKEREAAKLKSNLEKGEALRNAAKGGKIEEVRSLIAKGAPINSKDKVRTQRCPSRYMPPPSPRDGPPPSAPRLLCGITALAHRRCHNSLGPHAHRRACRSFAL